MKIYLDIKDGIIKDAKFKTFGCGAAVATSSASTELLIGKTLQEAIKITNKDVVKSLDGLPATKMHCSVLAEESINLALWDYANKNNIVIDGLKPPSENDDHHHHDHEEE